MASQDPTNVGEELEEIQQELDEYEKTGARLHQLASGVNPNSFPREGESEAFLHNKLKELSLQVVKRVAKVVSRGVAMVDKEVQTFKEMSD